MDADAAGSDYLMNLGWRSFVKAGDVTMTTGYNKRRLTLMELVIRTQNIVLGTFSFSSFVGAPKIITCQYLRADYFDTQMNILCQSL